jgi:hypothetical protein
MMKDKKMDEYRKAFNEGGAVESSAEDMNVADNKPTEAAPEGIAETPAVAVVIAEGAPEGEMPADAEDKAEMSPQDMQRAKSWEGRIKKREAELAAREAELAAREAALNGEGVEMAAGGKVCQKKDGGKVEMMAEGGEVMDDEMMPADEMTDPMTGEAPDLFAEGEGMADEGMEGDMAEADAAPASDDPVEQMAADYGPEIVAAVTAIVERTVRKIVEEMGGAFASEVEGKIAEIMRATNEGFGMIQGEMLRSVVDDIDDVLESDEFTAWVESLPEEEKAQAKQVIDAGTPSQGIKLIRQYKARSKGPSPEDVWAEDAAVAVKGKSPVRLPDRPSMSPEDEYRAAFNAA